MSDASTPPPSSSSSPDKPAPAPSSWKLPDGIEDHLETGLLKLAVGATAGGLLGVIMFRSGSGWRAASAAAGAGVALGSTYERIRYSSSSSPTKKES